MFASRVREQMARLKGVSRLTSATFAFAVVVFSLSRPGMAWGEESAFSLAIEVSLPRVRIGWPTQPDTVYEVRRASALEAADWTALCGLTLGNGQRSTALDIADGLSAAFYRVSAPDATVVRAAERGDRSAATLARVLNELGYERSLVCLGEGDWLIDEDVVVGSNVTLCVSGGSRLFGTGSLAFDGGHLMDSTNHMFDVGLRVTGLVRPVRPEWWGFAEDAAISVNAQAMQKAVRAAHGAVVEIPEGVFPIGAVSLSATNIIIQGQGAARYDNETGRLTGGTRLVGSLQLGGEAYGVRMLSVEFGEGSIDPLVLAGGRWGRLSDLTVLGNTNATENAHNVFFVGEHGVAHNIAVYNAWGHGFVSKSTGLRAVHILAHNCRYGVTIKSGCAGDPPAADNLLRDIEVTADNGTGKYGMIFMACGGEDMFNVTVSDFRASNLYMGIDLEASNGSEMRNVTIDGASIENCSYGYRSYMSSPGIMTNVTLRACEAVRCSVGYYQQAPGAWVDVVSSAAIGCSTPVAGVFRTADILITE